MDLHDGAGRQYRRTEGTGKRLNLRRLRSGAGAGLQRSWQRRAELAPLLIHFGAVNSSNAAMALAEYISDGPPPM